MDENEFLSSSFDSSRNVLEVINIDELPAILNIDETIEDEVELFNMTSLGTLMLLGRATRKGSPLESEDDVLHRLSLAYERLHSVPKILLQELAPVVKILDISHNEFDNLDFLCEFKEVTTLICDHNNINTKTVIPYIPKLELLWLNHCKINELYPWAKNLRYSCPNLKYLSLMGNPAAPSYLNGGNFYEYLHYRLFIISLFPKLVHLDDREVTDDQREEAQKVYKTPLVDRILPYTQIHIPPYLKDMSVKFSELLNPIIPPHREKNFII